ncbi:MAG: hypothetical protein EA397_01750 [Deltaproteobacteria bacterium]|nr:MAG: hypothetical protein EA397_01750 [Deltaproteobacteria bacterium]
MDLRTLTLAGLLALVSACTTEQPAPPAGDTPGDAPPAEGTEAAAPLGDLDPAELSKSSEKRYALVPSPVETQGALESAGIDTKLATLIPQRDMDFDDEDIDDIAVRTGVVIADMLLTVKTSSNEQLLTHLDHIKVGMKGLDGGSDIDRTLDDIIERVKGEAVSRAELLKELDEISGAIIPELEFNGNERVVPLIQAGSWLQGSNLVARATKAAGKPSAADGILKQPKVVDYFIEYVTKGEGKDKAPAAVTEKLESSLRTLKELAESPDSLDDGKLDTVIQVTEDVLALL